MKEDRVTISEAVVEPVVSGLSAEDDVRSRLRERFALVRDPFAEDSGFFYTGARRQHSLETLRHLCCFGDMVLLLSGSRGAGKTRTLAELCRREKGQLDFRLLPASQLTSIRALAACLLAQANSELPLGQSAELVVSGFFRWSETAARKDRRMVLLVDDANRVPSEVLKALISAFRAADRSQAAVPLLAGEDPIVRQLTGDDATESAPWLHQIHLKPLGVDDIADYIDQAMKFGGAERYEAPSAAQLKQIRTQSDGVLGRLRRATPAVLTGMSQSAGAAPKTKPRSPKKAGGFGLARWAALVVLLMLVSYLVMSWFYKSPGQADSTTKTLVIPERPMVHMAQPNPGPSASAMNDGADSASQEKAPSSEPSPSKVAPAAAPSVATKAPEKTANAPETPVVQPSEEKSAETSGAAVAGPGAAVDGESSGKEKMPQAAVEKPAPTETQATAKPAPSVSKSQVAASIPALERKRASPPAFSPALPSHYEAVSVLKSQGAYTIQMSAGHNESTAIDFIHRHASVSLVYTRSSYKGKPWYVVVHGTYRDSQAAHKALDQLPEAMRKQGPWVRRTAGL